MSFMYPTLSQYPFYKGYLRTLIILGILSSTGGMLGCATSNSNKQDVEDYSNLVWPLPPEQPRIKYLRTLFSSSQVVPPESTMARLRDNLLGKKGKSGQTLKKPYAVHVDNKGRIFVADSGWGKVLVFDEKNQSFDVWGTSGSGVLVKPFGVTSDDQGNIYITDSAKQRVIAYDPDGKFLLSMGAKDQLKRPTGIVFDKKRNRLYVVDTGLHQIVVYNKSGDFIETIGKRGEKNGEFNFPSNIALDSSGKIYIADSMNFRIQILESDGTFYKTFGEHGDGLGQFVRPKGVAVDSFDNIYVADAAFNNIQIFNSDGQVLLHVGSMGREPGQFILPAGLYIDPKNKIYVADQYNFRIQEFQYLEAEKNAAEQSGALDQESGQKNSVTTE